ncbi:MAG TPA: ABC transporter ATP-binding protein, partial [Chitinophagales bacterium]|nr:ABC transporter ATP-binding protein [Chitinophagales bacterium]
MEELALEVVNLWKGFRMQETRHDSFKEAVSSLFSKKQGPDDIFYALKYVSFNLRKGESLGIIGKNGAGKSTLLRVLSGISQPDQGYINFYGRTVSVIDIGAGFHPELTGRENIYLSASLYKFSRKETDENLERILAFADIGRFIDEPVKNYSSGMYLRLAFAIITCLDADIYLIDEVINVGDADFQVKCKIRIEELMAAGKTMLIASHNLNEIMTLCPRIMLMEDGMIVQEGGIEVIQKYLTRALPQYFLFENSAFYHIKDFTATGFRPKGISILDCGLSNVKSLEDGIDSSTGFTVYFDVELSEIKPFVIRLKVYDSTGILIFGCSSYRQAAALNETGKYRIEFNMPANIFNDRMYAIDMVLFGDNGKELLMKFDKLISFKIASPETAGPNSLPENMPGMMKPVVKINTQKI